MKRAVIIVIDALGIGAMPDCKAYGDIESCNTLVNVACYNQGINLPNFEKLGLGNITDIKGVSKVENPTGSYGIMHAASPGKDTTTGHWELAGLILDKPFKTYPEGFPAALIDEFILETGCNGILGNYPASGTTIINELGDFHIRTKFPIVYTSADSVFQIACHTEYIALDALYKYCKIARKLLDEGEYGVSIVIARPFTNEGRTFKRISADRRDYSVPPHSKTVLNLAQDQGAKIIGVGKIEDIFVKSGITHAIHSGSNKEGLNLTLQALKNRLDLGKISLSPENKQVFNDKEIIFTNLVDTDMLFGHRNDPAGYANALEDIDSHLSEILNSLGNDDLLIITADHGCDPTVPGTDHTREMVPVLMYGKALKNGNLGVRKTFADVGATVSDWLELGQPIAGTSLLNK